MGKQPQQAPKVFFVLHLNRYHYKLTTSLGSEHTGKEEKENRLCLSYGLLRFLVLARYHPPQSPCSSASGMARTP